VSAPINSFPKSHHRTDKGATSWRLLSFSNGAIAMSNSVKSAPQPAIIVFGLSTIGKPRAGTFKGTDVAAARKAAAKLGLTVAEIADPAGRAIAAKIPSGRIGASADGIVPFVSKDIYEQIKAIGPQKNGKGESETTAASSPVQIRLPANWDDIKVGDRVLAQETDPEDGWWQVTVTEANSDLFKLRWPGSGRGRPFQKHRSTLGLICPGEIKEVAKPDPKQAAAEPAVYPAHWSVISLNQIVLAKEDGPAEQWWEAKTIKLDKDVFTLEWRDHPQLPAIVRPRCALGLVHPSPKVR
jgi:hypothetical protein